jgi:preprotein translocase subunit SecE
VSLTKVVVLVMFLMAVFLGGLDFLFFEFFKLIFGA